MIFENIRNAILTPFLIIWVWRIFFIHKNSLPTESKTDNPKLEYEIWSGSFIWEDEGLWECKSYQLAQAFRFALVHRTQLLVGPDVEAGPLLTRKFDRRVYNMAKRYFPDWIGFHPSRCTYDPKYADRLQRIWKVADWQMKKLEEEEDKMEIQR